MATKAGEEGYRRRIMYRAEVGVRCGVRREETLEEKEVEGEGEVRSWRGVRRSLAMVMRRPKEEGSDRRVLN